MAKKQKRRQASGRRIVLLGIFLVVLIVVMYSAIVLRDYKFVSGTGIMPQLTAKYPVPSTYTFVVNNQVPEKISLSCKLPQGADTIEYRMSRFKNMAFSHTYKTANGNKEIGMLSGGKKYYIQARVFKKNLSGRSVHGVWSGVKETTVKKKEKTKKGFFRL